MLEVALHQLGLRQGARLQCVGAGAFAVLVVPHLRLRHGAAHRRTLLDHGVGTQVDHVHAPETGMGASRMLLILANSGGKTMTEIHQIRNKDGVLIGTIKTETREERINNNINLTIMATDPFWPNFYWCIPHFLLSF